MSVCHEQTQTILHPPPPSSHSKEASIQGEEAGEGEGGAGMTMLDSANLLRGVRPPSPPRDEYDHTFNLLRIDALCCGTKETWKDRIARRIINRMTMLLLRDADVRRRLCLALAPELRDASAWMDKPLVHGSAPPPDKDHRF